MKQNLFFLTCHGKKSIDVTDNYALLKQHTLYQETNAKAGKWNKCLQEKNVQ